MKQKQEKKPTFLNEKVKGFEEPPPPRERRYNWVKIADQLKARPNEWAKVFDDDKASLVVAIRAGNVTPMRASNGIEVRTTNNIRPEGEVRRCTLYARYVPENDENKEK